MIAYEVCASGAFFTALLADCFAHLIASAAFVLTFAAFEAEFAVIAKSAIFHAISALSAMVLVVAVSVRALAAVIAVIALPVVVTPSAAVFALNTVLVVGINGS